VYVNNIDASFIEFYSGMAKVVKSSLMIFKVCLLVYMTQPGLVSSYIL